MLPLEMRSFWLYSVKNLASSVPADLTLASDLAFVFNASRVRPECCVDPLRPLSCRQLENKMRTKRTYLNPYQMSQVQRGWGRALPEQVRQPALDRRFSAPSSLQYIPHEF